MKKTFVALAILSVLSACSSSDDSTTPTIADDDINNESPVDTEGDADDGTDTGDVDDTDDGTDTGDVDDIDDGTDTGDVDDIDDGTDTGDVDDIDDGTDTGDVDDTDDGSDTDDTDDTDLSSLSSRLVTELDDDGYPEMYFDCYDQNDDFALELYFQANGEGMLTQDEDAEEADDYQDFSWQESTGESVLMSVDTEGDSQLQTIVFLDDGSFTTTDSSIAGSTPGPLSCDSIGEAPEFPDTDDDADDVPDPEPGVEALEEAVEEALNEADGSESPVAFIADNLVTAASEEWQCTSSTGDSLSLSFGSDGNGSLSGSRGSASFGWMTTEAPGLVMLSVDDPNDGAIAGISFDGEDAFSTNLIRFYSTDSGSLTINGGRTSCLRN